MRFTCGRRGRVGHFLRVGALLINALASTLGTHHNVADRTRPRRTHSPSNRHRRAAHGDGTTRRDATAPHPIGTQQGGGLASETAMLRDVQTDRGRLSAVASSFSSGPLRVPRNSARL